MTIAPEGEPGRESSPGHEPGTDEVETAVRPGDDVLAQAAGIIDDVAEHEFAPQDVAAMDALDTSRRLLLVHAHPDDESLGNGATMARYAAAGASVTLITCTRGERGEVVDPALAHLEGDRPAMAAHRTGELATAMEALGVSDHRFLDDAVLATEDSGAAAPAHYEDSGMAWGEGFVAIPAPDTGPDAFAVADLTEAASRLAGVLREVRPQVVITYEAGGGYGHPDHVRAHQVTMLAVTLAADVEAPLVAGSEPWTVAKVYESVVPRSQVPEAFGAFEGASVPSMVVDDDQVTAIIEAPEQLGAKGAALRAHSSQVITKSEPSWQFQVSHDVWQPLWTTETYRLATVSSAPPSPDVDRGDGLETDLFAGVVH